LYFLKQFVRYKKQSDPASSQCAAHDACLPAGLLLSLLLPLIFISILSNSN